MILVHPLSPLVGKIERHLIWLWPLFWTISLIVNGGAWSYTGFVNQDGYCTLNGAIGGNFVNIFQFIPRAIVVCVILVLYTHLFFFLRRINLFAAAIPTNQSGNMAARDANISQQSRGELSIAIPMQHRKADNADVTGTHAKPSPTRREKSSTDSTLYSPISSLSRKASTLLAKVRRTDSSASRLTPSTLVEGDHTSKRNGSASSQGQASSSCAPGSLQDTVQTVDYHDAEQTTTGGNNAQKSVTVQVPFQKDDSKPYRFNPETVAEVLSPEEQISPKTMSIPLLHRPGTTMTTTMNAGSASRLAVSARRTTAPGRSSESLASSRDDLIDDDDGLYAPMAVRRDVRDFGMTSPPQEHLRHYSLSAAGVKMAKKALAESKLPEGDESDDQGVAVDERPETTPAAGAGTMNTSVTYEDNLGANWTWGMAVNQAEDAAAPTLKPSNATKDDARISTDTGRAANRKRQSLAWPRKNRNQSRPEGVSMTSSSNSSDGNGVETTGSTLNRQASVLLLLYPAAYVLLFSVSMVRFFVDIIPAPEERDPNRNADTLHSIARWTIFAQGAIDALVFQLIERQFRRRMKRRRRIAAGEHVDDTCAYKAYTWLRRSMQRSLKGRGSSSTTVEDSQQKV